MNKPRKFKDRYVLGEGVPFANDGLFNALDSKNKPILRYTSLSLAKIKSKEIGDSERIVLTWPNDLIPWPHPKYRLVLERIK